MRWIVMSARSKTPGPIARVALTGAIVILLGAGGLHAQTGSVSGTVYDSIGGGPLMDAAVALWDTPYRGATDSLGQFTIEAVPAGDYSVVFFHTLLGELGVSAGPRAVSVEAGATASVELGTPSIATLFVAECLMEEHAPDAGTIAGRVTDGESGLGLSGAWVTLMWSEEGNPNVQSQTLRTDGSGWYHSCDVPVDVPFVQRAGFLNRTSSAVELSVRPNGFVHADSELFTLRPTRVTGRLVDAATGQSVEGAEAWLRGTRLNTLSDDDGNFIFEEVPPGTYMLMTDHLAYGTKMDTLVVPDGQRLIVDMRLDSRPIEIAPITVTTQATPVEIAERRGGLVVTRDEIEAVRQRAKTASEVLQYLNVPGLVMRYSSSGETCVGYQQGQVTMEMTSCVPMIVYINDVRSNDPHIAVSMPVNGIERMVIYKPLEAGNLFGAGGGNGVWMIYTKGN